MKPAFCSIPLHCVPAVFVIVRKDSVLPALSKTCKNMMVTWRVTLLQSQNRNTSAFAFLFPIHADVSQWSPDLAFSRLFHLRPITKNEIHFKFSLGHSIWSITFFILILYSIFHISFICIFHIAKSSKCLFFYIYS